MKIIEMVVGPGRTRIRGRFLSLDHEQERVLNACIFSPTSAWLGDRFVVDKPWHSLLHVLLIPIKIVFGHRSWMSRVTSWSASTEEGIPRMPIVLQQSCRACGAALFEGLARCEVCGTAQVDEAADDLSDNATVSMWKPVRRTGVVPMLSPSLILTVAIALIAGWKPVVEAFEMLVPVTQWERVTYHSRLEQLRQADEVLNQHFQAFHHAVEANRPLPSGWGVELWQIRSQYNLYGYEGHRPETAELEAKIYSTLLSMASAALAYEKQDVQYQSWLIDIEADLLVIEEMLWLTESAG